MVRCIEFYQYWRQHPNFCGKERTSVYYIDSFVKLLDSLIERGIAESVTIVTISEWAARPLFTVKEKSIYESVVDIIAEYIKRDKRPISAADIKTWIDLVRRRPKNPATLCTEPEDTCDESECVSCDSEPAINKEDDPSEEDPTIGQVVQNTIAPNNTNETYLKKLSFKALVCPTCIEVRNHKCTVNIICPVCGASLVKTILKVDRVIE